MGGEDQTEMEELLREQQIATLRKKENEGVAEKVEKRS